MHQHFCSNHIFFRYRLMHQKVQIHSVFLIHKKLHFVNASLGVIKWVCLLINTYTNASGRSARPSVITDWLSILLLWLYVWSGDSPSKISIVFSDTARHYLLMAVFCHVFHFPDFIFPRNNCVWALRFRKLVCLLIDTHTNPQRILVSLSAVTKMQLKSWLHIYLKIVTTM